MTVALAFDRQSVRRRDADGRLHIAVSNISKANVCPYMGCEIPGWQALNLQPDRVYRLLRDPLELAAAADSFNNLPILDEHVPVSAFDPESHQSDKVIGSTGTDAAFSDPYMQNSAVIWAHDAISDIDAADRGEPDGRREWSCSYRYTPDMTPGNFRGLQYDGVMRNIIGNHVALVREGRAGPDVMIGDCSMLKSRKALLLHGAMLGLIRPKLAADARLDLEPLLTEITAVNLEARAGQLSVAIAAAAQPCLAADTTLDIDDVASIISSVHEMPMVDDAMPSAPAVTPPKSAPKADDADPDDDDEPKDPPKPAKKAEDADPDDMDPAMDNATVIGMISDAVAAERRRAAAIQTAREDVAGHIGTVTGAIDSAADIYKLALDAAGISTTDRPRSAFRHMVAMLPKPGANREPTNRVAMDQAADSDFRKRFPTAGTLVRA